MCVVNCYSLAHKLCIIAGVLLFKLNCFQHNRNYVCGTEANFFRFHDFEPRSFHFRYANETLNSIDSLQRREGFENFFHLKKDQMPEDDLRREKSNVIDRNGRGFHFHTTDKDTTVEVEFIVPFMRIPIEGGKQLTKATLRNLMNLKTGSLLWTGTMVVVGAIVAGAWNTISALKTNFFPPKRNVRSQNNFNSVEDDIGAVIDQKLRDYNIDLSACLQKTICQYAQKTTNDVRAGRASSVQKMFDGLVNAQIWPEYLTDTAVHDAIVTGRNASCNKWKLQCKVPKF